MQAMTEAGLLTQDEFLSVITAVGDPITLQESAYLFMFWDTAGGQREPRGFFEIELALSDLLSTAPQQASHLPSGVDNFKKVEGKANQPSQAGGIFGGGVYAAESAQTEKYEAQQRRKAAEPLSPISAANAPPQAPPLQMPEFVKPVNNASSIVGGIFGTESGYGTAAPSSARGSGTDRNRSSIEGGIFGGSAVEPPRANRPGSRNPNQSSIPGGIFGS
jgi:hypothetical protein